MKLSLDFLGGRSTLRIAPRLASLLAALVILSGGVMLPGCAGSVHDPVTGSGKSVLLVLTNHAELGRTGTQTGFYLPEAAHPWAVFRDAGLRVTLASPKGGPAPIDPKSLEDIDEDGRAFLDAFGSRQGGMRVVHDTVSIRHIEPESYDAVYFAGGHGTMWDFERDLAVARVASRVYLNGGVVGAVCHGPAALVNARAGGGWLLDGKRVTGFTNDEEAAVGLTDVMPFLLETRMGERGAEFVGAGNFDANVIVDGRLVTGQNPASAEPSAVAVVELLRE